ncbi:SDR family oxidoreductase [Streptomyces collinus]|uniref:SDR family oxidoreductase n=1 Tax=Streptomyces collinus TaxID=42684 RepID=UPI0037CE2BC4
MGLTRSTALDYAASSVRVNAVCSGVIDTEMIRRFAERTLKGRGALVADQPIGRLARRKRSGPPCQAPRTPAGPRHLST